jgi:hypothetical protein
VRLARAGDGLGSGGRCRAGSVKLGRQRGRQRWVRPVTGRPARGGRCRGRAGPGTGWAASGRADDWEAGAKRATPGSGGWRGVRLVTGTTATALGPNGGSRMTPRTGRTMRCRVVLGARRMATPRSDDCGAKALLGEGGGVEWRRCRAAMMAQRLQRFQVL